ncbi:MAG TPA: hemolysin family protein [Solirubrobacteraceae bacterium]|nr:hemolysin family protein [Solirubrobacteraceae bacterium]
MTALLLAAVGLLVLLNGFFVAAEFALVRARKSKLETMAQEGKSGAATAVREIEDISEALSACQLGITLASIAIGFLGEPAIAELVEPAFGGLSHGAAVAIAVIFAYVVTTSAHITVGEQVPKIYAITNAETIARLSAPPLRAFRLTFRPAVALLNRVSNGLLRIVGVRPEQISEEEGGTPEELKLIIAESLQGGKIDPGEAVMLSGVFHLHEQAARQVMTPIPAVVTIDVSDTVQEGLRRCVETGHTRLLVVEDDNADRVRGIVHVNSLGRALLERGPDAPLEPLVKDAPIIPETKPLDDLLAELQRQRTSMAVVVDEYGRVVGIVTVEDILEEVVGEIEDETDPAGGAVRRLPNGDWFVRGHVAVTDLTDYGVQLPVDSDAYNSIGGYVFDKLGRLPRRGDTVSADGYSIRVESVRENRIEAVRVRARGPTS